MSRPHEYQNLIRLNCFAEQPRTPGALEAYLANARAYLAAGRQLDADEAPMPVFSVAYEGFFQVVQAVLEFHEIRIRDAGRNMAIQRVCADLGMTNAEFAFVVNAHMRRNGTSYTSPFPPISASQATALLSILDKYLKAAQRLTGTAGRAQQ